MTKLNTAFSKSIGTLIVVNRKVIITTYIITIINLDLLSTRLSYFGRSFAFSSRILIHFFNFPIRLWRPMELG